jgi:phosphoribosylamine--glycine ligase
MKILVIGGGGREHAIAWALARATRVTEVFVAPGNGGTAREPGVTNLPIADFPELIAFAKSNEISLTVVGPEAPLAAGIVDQFEAAGLKIFGPSQAAAQLESSKDFSKSFMMRHRIPTAAYQTFSDAQAAHQYVDDQGAPIVVKADGLAAGKGVIVAMTNEQAHQAIDDMLIGNSMGDAGSRVVIEEFLTGEEASFIALVDGENVLALASSQDHKRLLDGDEGPNTGGMGAYSPAPVVTDQIHRAIMDQVIEPTVRGMAQDGNRFSGFLYAGIMVSPDNTIKTLEFNCRMGDPETQPILMRLRSDLSAVLESAVNGQLDQVKLDWDPRCAMGVVLAAPGYPTSPKTGATISGLPQHDNNLSDDCVVFHAGTKSSEQETVTSGGRVMCVTALGDSVEAARKNAYAGASSIDFADKQMRSDIGYRAIARSTKAA